MHLCCLCFESHNLDFVTASHRTLILESTNRQFSLLGSVIEHIIIFQRTWLQVMPIVSWGLKTQGILSRMMVKLSPSNHNRKTLGLSLTCQCRGLSLSAEPLLQGQTVFHTLSKTWPSKSAHLHKFHGAEVLFYSM